MTNEFTIEKIFGNYEHAPVRESTKEAFIQYTGDAYKMMNRAARSRKFATLFTPLLSEEEKAKGVTRTEKRQDTSANVARVNAIKDYFKDSQPFYPPSRMILYRKIKTEKIQELREKGTLIDNGFTSTTTSLFIGVNVSTVPDGYTVRLHLLPFIPYKLYPIKYFSSSKSEDEVLFDSNMKYYLCNTTHKMKIVETDNKCVDVLDCIFIPKELDYLLDGEWFDRWSHIINAENKYIFTDIIPINCYHRLDRSIFHFIKEIEYFIQKNIWAIMIDYDAKPLIDNPYMTIKPFADTLISDYNGSIPYAFINSYRGIILDNIIRRCIEFAEKIPKKNHFRYRSDWLKFISGKNIRLKNGGAALQILADLNALLKAVDGPQYSSAGGLKKEIRKSIRNVNALIATQVGRE